MKMKLLDRLILRFGAFLTLISGGLAVTAGILLYGKDLGDGAVMRALPLVLIISGAIAVIISVLNVLVARRYTAKRRAFITQHNEMGELRIAVSAVESLIQKCVETHKEVKVQEMGVSSHRGGIDVNLRVSMNSNVSIPHAIEQLQSQIKRYLAASSGLEVHNITVSVDKTPVNDIALPEEPVEAEAAEEREEEKIPLHQRIFGRDPDKSEAEQIVAAEYVQPPQPEENAQEDGDIAADDAQDEEMAEEPAVEPTDEETDGEKENE